jgi:hypothetical protein
MTQDRHMEQTWTFDAELWRWDGPAAWIFISIPEDVADDIADLAETMPRAGFGSVRVHVSIGSSHWTTSLFPDKSRGTYLLPVKKAVRTAQSIDEGDRASVTLELADV